MNVEPVIKNLTDEIAEKFMPLEIFLVSAKRNNLGELTSFKLCVIVTDNINVSEFEGEVYMNTECEIPFDIIAYNVGEWNELLDDDCTFASRIDNEGVILYEQKQQSQH